MENVLFRTLASAPAIACIGMVFALAGCDSKPPGWESLLAAKVVEQYPAYSVSTAPGQLLVARPGLDSKTIDVGEIARLCSRGPRDCDYATGQMLLELRPPELPKPKTATD